jgi:hypothetical protein
MDIFYIVLLLYRRRRHHHHHHHHHLSLLTGFLSPSTFHLEPAVHSTTQASNFSF